MTQKMSDTDIDSIKQQNAEYAIALARRDDRIRSLNQAIQTLEAQLYQERTTRGALKRLYQGVDRKILSSLHRKGAKKSDTPKVHPALRPARSGGYRELIATARIYDIEEFFMKSKPKDKRELKLRYHIATKAYVGIRDASIEIIKKVYRKRVVK